MTASLSEHPLLPAQSTLHIADILRHKRDGLQLSNAEIEAFVQGVVNRTITDAQAAAMLMAIFLRGLTPDELSALTAAMRNSGEVLNNTQSGSYMVDKHSTGGVGDKSSLLIAPIVAAAGFAKLSDRGAPAVCVPMISGRALAHTGGTLDKLETIPGFNTQLSLDRFAEVLRACGASLIGQTPTLVPADRLLYALRDHTSTVESPALIAASIMSKKLAEGLDALVLDVKTGSGAFLREITEARELANLMVTTGEAAGTTTVALLTDMSQPLGRYAGNWLEVQECVDILEGRRNPLSNDLIHLTNTLAGWMLCLAGQAESAAAGYLLSNKLLATGAAYTAWLRIVEAQGGDTSIFKDPARFHVPGASAQLRASAPGYLASMDCTEVGWVVQRLGAGRERPGDPVSAHAGLEVHVKLGSRVKPGDLLFTLYADSEAQLSEPLDRLRATLVFSEERPALPNLVREVVRKQNNGG